MPPEGGTDEYRCFLIDPKFTEAGYLTGSQFFPQNTEIVHHGIFYQIAASDVAQAKKVDARTKGDGWQCFGGSGLDDDRSDYIGAWAWSGRSSPAGAQPAANTKRRKPAGSLHPRHRPINGR